VACSRVTFTLYLSAFSKWAGINTGCDVKNTVEPIRDESYPHLPSKPIRDEDDQMTKITISMSCQRTVVNGRKCGKKIAKKSKGVGVGEDPHRGLH